MKALGLRCHGFLLFMPACQALIGCISKKHFFYIRSKVRAKAVSCLLVHLRCVIWSQLSWDSTSRVTEEVRRSRGMNGRTSRARNSKKGWVDDVLPLPGNSTGLQASWYQRQEHSLRKDNTSQSPKTVPFLLSQWPTSVGLADVCFDFLTLQTRAALALWAVYLTNLLWMN